MSDALAVWLTGIPSSGKTTIAKNVAKELVNKGYKVVVLESDEIRRYLTPNPKYTEEERGIFYHTLAVIGKYLVDNGIIVIFDATGHKREYREYARKLIKNFMEVYLYCPLEECMKRDVKGLYKKALKGEINTLPGLQVMYEEPLNPDIRIETYIEDVKSSVEKIVNRILENLNQN